MSDALTLSLPEQIAARLSERIISGRYAPGERIMEQALALEFEVSRGPVREALRLVEKDGLVRILPRRGAQVSNLTAAEVKEIFDVRAMLNGLRDRLIAEDPDRAPLVAALEEEVQRLAKYAGRSRPDDYVNVVATINRMLTEGSRSSRLKSILGSLALQTLRYTQLGLATQERRQQSLRHWQALVRALRTGDGEKAERIARQRVTDSRDAAIGALKNAEERRGGKR
jgi:DNA-binding GntR family transcriptional regulator